MINVPSKMGRPKIDKPKTMEAKSRIDEETNRRLLDYCKKNRTNRAEVVRKGIELVLGYTKE